MRVLLQVSREVLPVNIWIRRSLKVGLLAGGFVCIGAGIASARGTSPVAAPSDQNQVVVDQSQNHTNAGPLDSVLGQVTSLVQGITSQQSTQHTTATAAADVP